MYSNRSIDIPKPGHLTVSIDKYKTDSKLIIYCSFYLNFYI